MKSTLTRRHFLAGAALLPSLASGGTFAQGTLRPRRAGRIKLSCNLYSFNDPLRKGEMSLDQVLELCSELGFDAVDPTGYYFPGYPEVPPDKYLFEFKKKAHLLGLDISGTGVRNDFTLADAAQRSADVALVKKWVAVAAKLGAPVLRVFAGKELAEGRSRAQANDFVVEALRLCAAYGQQQGVMIVLQNHNEFLKTTDEVLHILQRVDSDWLGLNLDIGSLRQGDPYAEIARLAPYAYTWQLKENVYRQGVEEKTDVAKIIQIAREAGYRGYLPIETLRGDPRVQVPRFLAEVQAALGT
ncbi:sugar phosphate isomerase/epimerase [Rhabdobacter roseus]|uniref:Sugar phosphate isomerase/epimerase n=1 Tax=Rhabdobacter roseus TaxID=1655419 RepID=A0A840TUM9_9BACT|nr:sugar phosphate isomerase/epimerase family protein [Rhabdobacter roseus]MBB5283768.1 sugar phosphate isomerase/epimerase [Rhabdobacter roseus]